MRQIQINYCPHAYQRSFHSSPKRFRVIVGGRRVGKSLSALHEVIRHCVTTPNANAWWVSPTLGDARDVGFMEFKEYLDELDCVINDINETRMCIRFTNGSMLTFKSAEKEKSLRGRGLTFVVLDEGAFIHPDIWFKALRPALSDKQGKAVILSTANGRNWFFQLYTRAKDRELYMNSQTWSHYHWPTRLNPLITTQEVEDAREDMADSDFRQEYLAEFVTRAGMVYTDFDTNNIIQEFTINHDIHDIYLGADFGYANPSAIAFIAVDRRSGRVTIFDEIYEARKNMEELTILLLERLETHGLTLKNIRAIYTDPAGNASELTSGISPVDYLRMELGVEVINRGSLIAPGLALVRSFIKNAKGQIKLHVLESCMNTVKSFEGYAYGDNRNNPNVIKEEPEKDGVFDHMMDAIRYFFVNKFDKAKWVARSIDQQDYLVAKSIPSPIIKRCNVCKSKFVSRTRKTAPPFVCNGCNEES